MAHDETETTSQAQHPCYTGKHLTSLCRLWLTQEQHIALRLQGYPKVL